MIHVTAYSWYFAESVHENSVFRLLFPELPEGPEPVQVYAESVNSDEESDISDDWDLARYAKGNSCMPLISHS